MIIHNHDVKMHFQDIAEMHRSVLPPLPKSSEDLSLDIRRLLKIDGRRYERKKNCVGSAHWQIDTNGVDGGRISCAFCIFSRASICGNAYFLYLFDDGRAY